MKACRWPRESGASEACWEGGGGEGVLGGMWRDQPWLEESKLSSHCAADSTRGREGAGEWREEEQVNTRHPGSSSLRHSEH